MNHKKIIFIIIGCLPGLGVAQEHTSEYYPLKKGSTWEYQSMGNILTVRCAGPEKVGNIQCMKMETLVGDSVVANEYLRIEKDGIYRYKLNDFLLQPPMKIMQLPPKKGAQWKVNSRAVGPIEHHMEFQGIFTQDIVNINVGGVAFRDVVVCKSKGFKASNQPFETAYYFAKGVGLIQQEITIGKNTIKVRLKKYTRANAKQK